MPWVDFGAKNPEGVARHPRPSMPMKEKTFNVAVLGAGAIGREHIASFQLHPHARVIALAESHAARGREIADRHGVPVVTPDYRELLRRPDIDVISIALPNHLHAPVALEALRAGKHVVIEKPMATQAREAARLVSEARRRRRVLMVGQNQRFLPETQTLRRLVADGVLGDVYHARATWVRRSGIPRIGSWFTQRRYAGGGCTYDLGAHLLDQALYLLDEFEAAAVTGRTHAKFGPRGRGDGSWGHSEIDPRRPFDVEDFSLALITLKSGRTVTLETAWAAHQAEPDRSGTQLFGTEAGATTRPLQLFRPGRRGYLTEALDPRPLAVTPNRMVHFVNVLLGREPLHVPPSQSFAVQRILDAIYRSAATGREVRL